MLHPMVTNMLRGSRNIHIITLLLNIITFSVHIRPSHVRYTFTYLLIWVGFSPVGSAHRAACLMFGRHLTWTRFIRRLVRCPPPSTFLSTYILTRSLFMFCPHPPFPLQFPLFTSFTTPRDRLAVTKNRSRFTIHAI